MKGVSLAIETIIYITLAVTVLTILLTFFINTGVPTVRQIELERKVINLCKRRHP